MSAQVIPTNELVVRMTIADYLGFAGIGVPEQFEAVNGASHVVITVKPKDAWMGPRPGQLGHRPI